MRMRTLVLTCILLVSPLAAFGQQAIAEGAEAEGVVIGKLGQALEETAIRSTPDDRAKSYYTTTKFQYLVVNPTKWEKWFAVVLQNGKTGYILSEKVARLPYDVRQSTPAPRTGGSQTSRSGIRAGIAGQDSKSQMLQTSFQYVGTPYRWGGNSLTNGIDCSGFVQQLFGKIGVDLPRTAAEQALVGQRVERLEEMLPGDRLYFWDAKRGKIGHTGIFLGFHADGGAYFIHSSTNNKGVDTDDLRFGRWRDILVGVRRD
ncbi:MAG: C40 family peptidase [Fimbriimonadaceae bacterium]